jgi:hypothetical protein
VEPKVPPAPEVFRSEKEQLLYEELTALAAALRQERDPAAQAALLRRFLARFGEWARLLARGGS